jgi:hypothetical protein
MLFELHELNTEGTGALKSRWANVCCWILHGEPSFTQERRRSSCDRRLLNRLREYLAIALLLVQIRDVEIPYR